MATKFNSALINTGFSGGNPDLHDSHEPQLKRIQVYCDDNVDLACTSTLHDRIAVLLSNWDKDWDDL